MPRITTNSTVKRLFSKIDLNNGISLLERQKSILHLFEKSKATPSIIFDVNL